MQVVLTTQGFSFELLQLCGCICMGTAYWWSNWCWKKKTQVDDKPHECLWKTRSHYTQCPTVHCSRPPDDHVCRRYWSIHSAQASGHRILQLLIVGYLNVVETNACILLSRWHVTSFANMYIIFFLYTVSEMRHNLPHPVSSLPSVQSRVPSQRSEERTHWRLLHRNAPVLHETAIGDSNFKVQVREQN